ncbi:MAG: hypothetical protein J6R42_05690 [Clostridia bacterium]|nr:hypothetical protein [Clostridia bacterium]
MNEFVDLHSHILSGTDDGAQRDEDMFAMLDLAYACGTRHICLTPHFDPYHWPDNHLSADQAFEKLAEYATKYPDLTLYRGNELLFSYDGLEALRDGRCRTLNGTHYVLVEFSPRVSDFEVSSALNRLRSCGYRAIVAHVERYKSLFDRRDCLEELAEKYDARFQVNASTLFGEWGRKAKKFALKALRSSAVVAVVSDAHGTKKRAPDLRKAYAYIAKKRGVREAKRLFYDAPLAILQDKNI